MSTSTERARAPLAPATVVVALLIAFCALLLLKWLAVVALAALGLAALVWWARRDPTARAERRPAHADAAPVLHATVPGHDAPVPAPVAPRRATDDDCTWCGLPGGHRDERGRPLRPRHVHPF